MKLQYFLSVMATVVATVNAGNPENLRGPDYEPASDTKQLDFSDVNQVDRSAMSFYPNKCPLSYQPVKDEDGVVYQNKCIQHLLECSGTDIGLSASDFFDLQRLFDKIEGTIELYGGEYSWNIDYAEVPEEIMRNPPTKPKGFAEELLVEILHQASQRKQNKSYL